MDVDLAITMIRCSRQYLKFMDLIFMVYVRGLLRIYDKAVVQSSDYLIES